VVHEGQVLNNRYKLLSLQGEGGMAAVYQAQDLKLRRTVAVKVLHTDRVDGDVLLREAQAAAGVSHPNVVTVYDIGQDGDTQYIVMEYAQGRTLQELIEKEAPFHAGLALDIAVQICAAAEFIHRQGTLHCDLKPQNLLVTADGQVKVTDFGVARALSATPPAQRDKIWGTPYYASPEMIAGQPLTPASDVYAIGLILYEMLAGARPFEGQSASEIARQQVLNAPRPVQDHNPRVPRYVRQVIDHTLAKEPAKRYRTAGQLGKVLRTYRQHGEAITQPLPSIPAADASIVEPRTAPPAVEQRTAHAVSQPQPAVAPEGGFDWLMLVLGGLALIAVAGLLPIWGTVFRRALAQPKPPLAATPTYLATPTPTPDLGATALPGVPTATSEVRISVPDLVGREEEEARKVAQEEGLVLIVLERRHDIEVQASFVISQSVAVGGQVPPGAEIGVVVSLGPPLVTVPNAVGFPAAIKRLDLQDLGLGVFITETWSAEPAGLVITQTPSAGTEILAGSTVTLTVSSGMRGEVRANLGYRVSLVACELDEATFRPGDEVQLTITWQVLDSMSESYTVFVHITDRNGEIVAQRDAPPLGGSRPTNTWRSGEIFQDAHTLPLPTDLSPGTYWVRVGLYRGDRRLPVVDPGLVQAEEDALIVHQIEVKR
jgi:predicted Ser/Thr protein kinase